MKMIVAAIGVALLASCGLFGQTATKPPAFEVASTKPAGPYVDGSPSGGMVGGPGTSDPGRVTFPRASLSYLLAAAYGALGDQISGPGWLNSSDYRYVINATMPPNTTKEQFRLMLQNLLAERFHVRLHHETQSRPGYELVVAPGGTKLKEWTPATDAAPFRPGLDANGFSTAPPSGTFFGSSAALTSEGVPVFRVVYRDSMAVFCRALGTMIGTSNGTLGNGPEVRVADRTGLTGTYEIRLEFADGMRPRSAPASGEAGVTVASDPGEAPSVFTAVEKQLGLKLQKVKDVAVDVLVIDSADKVPTEN